jgi:hypothetical protein
MGFMSSSGGATVMGDNRMYSGNNTLFSIQAPVA